jgi:hypothetical protein
MKQLMQMLKNQAMGESKWVKEDATNQAPIGVVSPDA